MTRLMLSLLALCWGLAGSRAQDTGQAPSNHLSIDIVAIDRSGKPVHDLKADELEVWIGHYRVPIKTLTIVAPLPGQGEGGRVVGLLIDDLAVPPELVPRAREAALRFVSRKAPSDVMVLLSLSGATRDATGNPASLRRALEGYNVRASGLDRADVLSQHVLDTIANLAEQLREFPGLRKTIVAIGSSPVFDTPLPPPGYGRDVEPQWMNAMRTLGFAHTHLYVIDVLGVGARPPDGGTFGFARATGGHAFLNNNDMEGVADRILRDASTYYVLSVPDPPVGRTSDLRDLEVRVKRPDVSILAPRAIPGRVNKGD